MDRKIFICIIGLVLLLNGFLAFSIAKVPNSPVNKFLKVIAILPDKTKESKLLRIYDEETGVLCYMIQNDTADFYSGLQCLYVGEDIF